MNASHRAVILAALLTPVVLSTAEAACDSNIALTRADSRYVDHGDGTVTDNVTGLMWKQCTEGLSTTSTACDTGVAATFTWQGALQRALDVNGGTAGDNLGYTDWRLPNQKELGSLSEVACTNPAINTTRFPATPASGFWSSSPYAKAGGNAWYTSFLDSVGSANTKDAAYYVRLVRH